MNPPVFHLSEGLRKPTQIMSQIDGESGADESGGEGEWTVWREVDQCRQWARLMMKASKRTKESHSPSPFDTPDCLCCGDNLAKWEDDLPSTRLRLTREVQALRIAAESRVQQEGENSPVKSMQRKHGLANRVCSPIVVWSPMRRELARRSDNKDPTYVAMLAELVGKADLCLCGFRLAHCECEDLQGILPALSRI